MEGSPARRMWERVETIHAVTYFAPECIAANKVLGLKGFWMGYFGSRAAPLGPVRPGVVEALFFNFHRDMVRRSVPDAWAFASPHDIVTARQAAAAAALRSVAPKAEALAASLVDDLQLVIGAADGEGRALFAANRALDPPDDPVEALWLACTCLREHRGDGHVAALTAEGLDGCEAHVLFAAARQVPIELLRDNRGWSTDDWAAATHRLEARGLVGGGFATDDGRALHQHVEDVTDALAAVPLDAVNRLATATLLLGLGDIAAQVITAGILPFPNPMGLARPSL
jgi:hypothetical protein